MADAHDDHTLEEIRTELVDRFGELPEAATNLMAVAHLRTLAKSFGLTEVVLQGKFLRLAPVTLPDSKVMRLNRVYPGSLVKAATHSILVASSATSNWGTAEKSTKPENSPLVWAIEVLQTILGP